MDFSHTSVLLNESIELLDIKPDGVYIDGTAGGGGHSSKIAERLDTGRLVAIDRDPDAVEAASRRLSGYKNVTVVQAKYSEMARVAQTLGIDGVDGVLLDIGVSSHQFDVAERGFSYHGSAPLDMRMSQSGPTAADLVNGLSESELAKIFFEYGEEQFSYRIAKKIIEERKISPITTTDRLADIVSSCYPAAKRRSGNPARKVFQAVRIAVNGELDELSQGLDAAFELLRPGGVIAVITFHSIEDRIVKQRFAKWTKGCTCPPDFPVCVCGNVPKARLANRKPIEAGKKELSENPRSRSAKLRGAIRL